MKKRRPGFTQAALCYDSVFSGSVEKLSGVTVPLEAAVIPIPVCRKEAIRILLLCSGEVIHAETRLAGEAYPLPRFSRAVEYAILLCTNSTTRIFPGPPRQTRPKSVTMNSAQPLSPASHERKCAFRRGIHAERRKRNRYWETSHRFERRARL